VGGSSDEMVRRGVITPSLFLCQLLLFNGVFVDVFWWDSGRSVAHTIDPLLFNHVL